MKKTLLIETNAGVRISLVIRSLRFDKNADARLKLKYPNPEDYKNYINGLRKYNLLESLPLDDIVMILWLELFLIAVFCLTQ
jgi:hypothetical protein